MASFSAQPGSAQALGYGLGNYVRLFEFQEGLPRYFLNSVVVAVLTVAITLSVSTLGGYSFARFDFRGKNALFLLTLAILRRIMCPRSCRASSRSACSRSSPRGTTTSRRSILISDPSQSPLPLAIAILRQQTMGAIDYGATEAGVVVMALPALILFVILQRSYMRGFMSGVVKG